MTSRERVLAALNHEEPDRVPVALDCSQADKVEAMCRYFGVPDYEALHRFFDVDVRLCMCWEDTSRVNRFDSDDVYTDAWGVTRSVKGLYPVAHPLAEAETVEDLDRYDHWPSPDVFDYASYAKRAESLSEYAVLGGVWSPFMEVAEAMLGSEKFMIALLTEEAFVDALLDRILPFYIEANRRMFDALGDRMQVFFSGDDYGSQKDMLWSPDVWRRYVAPRLKQLYGQAKERGYKVMQHTCGSVVKIIPDLIEVGLDCLQPIQVAATGMNPAELKAQYGNKLAFMGGIDGQQVMPFGTPEDVRAEVRLRIEQMADGGGYLLCTSQGIMPEMPDENIRAMFDAAKEFGQYGN